MADKPTYQAYATSLDILHPQPRSASSTPIQTKLENYVNDLATQTLRRVSSALPHDGAYPRHLFHHLPLDLDEDQIRLVRYECDWDFEGSSVDSWDLGDSDIDRWRLVVKHFDRADAPEYTAVSYAWGDSSAETDIRILNEDGIEETESLYPLSRSASEFFTHAQGWRTEWLWMDQICIDQKNVLERNHQVEQMAEIYSGATHVVIWLGLPFRDCEPLFADCFPGCTIPKDRRTSNATSNLLGRPREDQSRYLHRHFTPLTQLLSLSYWGRLWICQEMLLARDVTILLGDIRCAWNEFRRGMQAIKASGWPTRDVTYAQGFARELPIRELDRVMTLVELRSRLLDRQHSKSGVGAHLTWQEAVALATTSECYDSRDKVFGILGLLPEDERIHVDYSQTALDVFSTVLLREVAATEGLLTEKLTGTMCLWRDALGLGRVVEDEKIAEYVRLTQESIRAPFPQSISAPPLLSRDRFLAS